MIDALDVSVSAQLALERRLATLADNVANMNTTGFRASSVRFEEVREEGLRFVSRGTTHLDTRTGAVRQTGNALDFVVRGEGWFGIETPEGFAVTRDGRFTMDPQGVLRTVEGHAVLDAGRAPVQLDPAGGEPRLGAGGTLVQGGGAVAGPGLFTHDPGEAFVRVGNTAILAPDATPADDARLIQSALEGANVDPVAAMTRLVSIHRTFDNVAAAMRDAEAASEAMIRTLGAAR